MMTYEEIQIKFSKERIANILKRIALRKHYLKRSYNTLAYYQEIDFDAHLIRDNHIGKLYKQAEKEIKVINSLVTLTNDVEAGILVRN